MRALLQKPNGSFNALARLFDKFYPPIDLFVGLLLGKDIFMFIFRCIVSGLLALGGAVLFFLGTYDDSLPLWLAAAIVLPYDAANKVVCGLATFCGAVGVYRLFCSDYVIAIMSVTLAAIVWIKRIRLIRENERLLHFDYSRFYRPHSSGTYSGGYNTCSDDSDIYSGSSGAYSDDSATDSSYSYDYMAEYERRQREQEEELQRQRDEERREELEEERRRTQEAFEADLRRREAENLSQRKYGCSADIASNWDSDIRKRL